jgi:transposase
MRTITLSETEKLVLEKVVAQDSNATYRKRCTAILMSAQQISVKTIAKFFRVRIHTVYHWFNLWEQQGITALKNKQEQGRKPKLSAQNPDIQEKIVQSAQKNSLAIAQAIPDLEAQLGISFSKNTLKRF